MKTNSGLPFIKLVGTGNDFLFLDYRDVKPETKLSRNELTARIAHRNFGVGSDGVIFVERQTPGSTKLKWDFYNPDGSTAEMCGNALRCMGRWAEFVLSETEITFETRKGDVTVRKNGEEFSAELKFVQFSSQPLPYGNSATAALINTGVPHAVVDVTSIDKREEMALAVKELRFHVLTGSAGANVTFVETKGERSFRTVTFERGVEGYTLSCGTGVLAAAVHGTRLNPAAGVAHDTEAAIETPGGRLRVLFKEKLSAVHLIGPADVICTGFLEERYLQ